ncbi:MAG: Calx-beta domain-containing protein [Blastocatellia bacterium]
MGRKKYINRRKFLQKAATGIGGLAIGLKEGFGQIAMAKENTKAINLVTHPLVEPLVEPQSPPFNLISISTGFNNPVGIDYHPSLNRVVISVNYPSGLPHNFELVAEDGTHAKFSNVSGLTDEVKIAVAQDDSAGMSIGGFSAGELFSGTGVGGHIIRISPDGNTVANPWVALPNESGLLRGSLHVDRTGVFGGDLIVVTTAGGVWRINSQGEPTKLASIPTHLEGLITVPNDVEKYGPWAGKILTGAEQQGRFYTIDIQGQVEAYTLEGTDGPIKPEDIDLIEANQNFFGVNYGGARIVGAPASAFADMVGDILVSQETPGYLYRVHWNKLYFEVTQLAQVPQWEHMTFAKSGIVEVDGIANIEFTSASYQVNESALTAVITVKRSTSSNLYSTVDYLTLETNAVSPTHFEATSGRLVFEPSETEKSFSVNIINDNIKDCNKSITLKLSNPTQAILGSITTAILTIVDDD